RQVIDDRSDSPNDYTSTNKVQTSGGDEGHLDLYGLNREMLRLKKKNAKQASVILKLKARLKKLFKIVKPVVLEHRAYVKIQAKASRKRKHQKKHKKHSSFFKQGRKIFDNTSGLNEVEEENDIDDQGADPMDVEDTTPA
ncbi:hypothetical protein Tco_0444020, partial [Tanacetum coccineum]